LKDIYTQHKAETDILKLELQIYKKVIQKTARKVKKQEQFNIKLSDTLAVHIMNKSETES